MLDKMVNILGTEWIVKEQRENENELLKDCDGYMVFELQIDDLVKEMTEVEE